MKIDGKDKIILNNIMKDFTICDIIILKVFKNYTLKIYKIGLNDAFNWENRKHKRTKEQIVLQGCNKAVLQNKRKCKSKR